MKNYIKTFEQFVTDKLSKVNEESTLTNDQLQALLTDWNKAWGDKITFQQGKWTLEQTDDTKKALGALLDLLKKQPTIKFEIAGHTNSDPIVTDLGEGVTDNQKLSEKRAQAVKDFLIKNDAALEARITGVVGKGETELIDANYAKTTEKSKEDKAKSRRVEIKLTGVIKDAVAVKEPATATVSQLDKKYLATIDPAIEDAKKRFETLPKVDGKVKSQKDNTLLDLTEFSKRYVVGQNQVIKNDLNGKKYTQEQLNAYIKDYIQGGKTFN